LKGGVSMLGFVIGVFVGGIFGVFALFLVSNNKD
jgi:hypothetical protein